MRHEVVIRQNEAGAWQGACRGCGAQSSASTHKPVVETWRKNHYSEAHR